MKECFYCGHKLKIIKNKKYLYHDSGIEAIIYGLDQYTCPDCGEEFAPIPVVKKLHNAIGINICEKNLNLLSGNEVRFLRKSIGCKVKNLATMLGVSARSITSIENNNQNIKDAQDRLLRSIFMTQTASQAKNKQFIKVLKKLAKRRIVTTVVHVPKIKSDDWL